MAGLKTRNVMNEGSKIGKTQILDGTGRIGKTGLETENKWKRNDKQTVESQMHSV